MDGIQSGDCGVWTFERPSGDLLGMLIAVSYQIGELYILPAREIFDDIGSRGGKTVIVSDLKKRSWN
jgi:hypothetical protein